MIKKITLFLLAILAVTSVTLSPLLTSNAAATDEFPGDRLERWFFYRGMWACLEPGFKEKKEVSRADIEKGQWEFNTTTDNREGFGYIAPSLEDNTQTGSYSKGDDSDGTVNCRDGSIWVRGATIFGFDSPVDLLCEMNRTGAGSKITPNAEDCEKSTSFKFDGGSGSAIQSSLTKALDKHGLRPKQKIGDNPEWGAMLYLMGKRSLEMFCGGGVTLEAGVDDLKNDTDAVLVDIVSSEGKLSENLTYRLDRSDRDENSLVDDVYYKSGSNVNEADDLRCHEMAKYTRDYSIDYAEWVQEHPESTAPDDENTGGSVSSKESTTCALDGVGWIVCPVVIAISKFNDALFKVLQTLLGISPSMFDTSGDTAGTYTAWQSVRNLANVAFAIAYMVIIYSQLTSAGISNYGIKKMLPRLVIAAILMNLSFWICAAFVDLSNIVGNSTHALLTDQVKTIGGNSGGNLEFWDELAGWLLAGGVGSLAVGGVILASAGPGGFMAALALLIPLAIVALLAVLTVVFVLVARQAFVIILVVLSPLAFVAYLLPNTEQWFDRWRKTFFAMLLIYPLTAMLFGGTQLASAVIRAGADDAMVFLLSIVVLVVPLFAVPLLLKISGGILGKVGAIINNPNRGPLDRMRKGGERYAERRRNAGYEDTIKRTEAIRKGERGRALGATGTRRRKAATWLSGIGSSNPVDRDQKDTYAKASADAAKRNYVADRALEEGSDKEKGYAYRMAGGDEKMARFVQSYAIQAKEEEERKDTGSFSTLMEHNNVKNEDLIKKIGDKNLSAAEQAAAGGLIMKRGHRESHLQAIDAVMKSMASAEAAGDHESMEALGQVQKQMVHDMKEKPWALGDQMLGQMTTGDLGKKHEVKDSLGNVKLDDSGKPVVAQYTDVQTELQKRVGSKLSPKSIATMNPDELIRIHNAAVGGQLTNEQMSNLTASIDSVRSNSQMNDLVKKESQDLYDSILAAKTTRDKAAQDKAFETYRGAGNVQYGPERGPQP